MKIQLGQDLASVKALLYLFLCSVCMGLAPQAWGNPGNLEIKLDSHSYALRDTFTADIWVYPGNSDIQSLSIYLSYHTESLSLINWEVDTHGEIDLMLVETHNPLRGIVGFEGGFLSPKTDSLHMLRLTFQVQNASDSAFIGFYFSDQDPGTEVFNSSTESILRSTDFSPLFLDVDCPEEPAKAGPDQDLCGNAAQLAANLPESYRGYWTLLRGEGGSFTDATNPTSFFVGRTGETYILSWTIEGYTCATASDTLEISFDSRPNSLDAGSDQVVFGDLTYLDAVPSTFFAEGSWRLLTEDPFAVIRNPEDPKSGFIGRVGHTYLLEWSEYRALCPILPDTVSVSFKDIPEANAGEDQVIINKYQTRLRANLPDPNLVGSWKILSGGIGTFSDRASPHASFRGRLGLTYTLEWKLLYQGNLIDRDTVSISFNTESRDLPRNGRITLFTPPRIRFFLRDRQFNPFIWFDLPESVWGNLPRKDTSLIPNRDSNRAHSGLETDVASSKGSFNSQSTNTFQASQNGSYTIDFYPNPVLNKRLSLYISGARANNFTFKIFNSSGQELLRGKWDLPGTHEVELNHFSPGVYTLLAIDEEGQKFVEKIFVE